ncbi:MAG TPA: M20/M25/M40 family metallo-hydrolase [Gemmataceae bacterium]|nr:M20/M25/M40 family metallo-hydrolase [Gemmataceae bacterium]
MAKSDWAIDAERAVERLMRFLAVEGVTGRERAIGKETAKALREVGVPASAIHFDAANERIPVPTETGNLIVKLPGTPPHPTLSPKSGGEGRVRGRLLFSTHLDTVPLCAGAVPVRSKNRITAKGDTALGGDNRTGVACLVTLAATLLERKPPHPPLTLLFTVREESGLFGARYLDPADLGGVTMGFNVDGKEPAALTIGAVGAERWEVEIAGKASHAGVHPEQGISATLVASLALAAASRGGWFGKVRQGGREGTANVGVFGGQDGKSAGEATNVVTDYVHIRGEARSHDPAFVKEIVAAWKQAFINATGLVKDDKGHPAKVKFTSRLDYHSFRLRDDAPVVRHAVQAAEMAGLTPTLRIGNGGLDANWLVRHKIPTVTFGAGQHNIHTTEEYVDVKMFLEGCQMALALSTLVE